MSQQITGLGVFGRTVAFLAATGLVAALSGCGAGSLAPLSGAATGTSSAVHIVGQAKGGQQPIYNATIQLWAAGTTGTYGTGATSLISSAVTSSATGTFDITGLYTCPTPDPQVYLTATGGNPTGDGTTTTNNSAIQLVAALGSCSALAANASTPGYYIQVNEVTTAAAAFALAQFYGGFGTTTDSIGAPSTNVNGLVNAFATAHNLASTISGTAAPTTPASNTNYALSPTDQQKLNTVANILSDCVNQTSGSNSICTNLYSYVKTTSGTAPTNTFQAAVYMNLNPQSINSTDTTGATNRTNLFNMQTPFMPFATALSAAPTDWTIALQYSGTGINYMSSVAIDAYGDIWMTNANNTGGLLELNGGTGHFGGTAGVAGSPIGYYTGVTNNASLVLNPSQTRQVAIDLNGDAWLGNFAATNSSTVSSTTNTYYGFRATPGTGIDSYFPLPAGSTSPYAVAIDKNGEVFFQTSSCNVTLYTSTTATSPAVLTKYNGNMGCSGPSLVINSANTAYNAVGTSMYSFKTSPYPPSSPVTTGSLNYATPYGSVLDSTGKVLTANETSGSYSISSFDTSALTTSTFSSSSCLKKPGFEAIDGSGNVWVSNVNTTADSTSGNFTVCEFDASGNLLSPSIGYGTHAIQSGRGIAVDLSGNVWVTSYTTASTATLTQIVGVASPAVTPVALAMKNGTIGTRP